MLRGPGEYKQEETLMQNEDFISGLGPLAGFRYSVDEVRRKRTPSCHKNPEEAGELLPWSRIQCLICQFTTCIPHASRGQDTWGTSMCAEAIGFIGLAEL